MRVSGAKGGRYATLVRCAPVPPATTRASPERLAQIEIGVGTGKQAQAELVAARCMDARVGPGSELVDNLKKNLFTDLFTTRNPITEPFLLRSSNGRPPGQTTFLKSTLAIRSPSVTTPAGLYHSPKRQTASGMNLCDPRTRIFCPGIGREVEVLAAQTLREPKTINRRQNTMRRIGQTTGRLIAASALALSLAASVQAADQKAPVYGSFHSAKDPDLPPLPFNPHPELSTVEVENGVYVVDDTVIPDTLQEAAARTARQVAQARAKAIASNPLAAQAAQVASAAAQEASFAIIIEEVSPWLHQPIKMPDVTPATSLQDLTDA